MQDHHRHRGRLVGVGVGPGDPSLVTLKALEAFRSADRVAAPCASEQDEGRAEAIVRSLLPELMVERLVFEMAPGGGPTPACLDSLSSWLGRGEVVAYATLGDPSCYSTFWSLLRRIEDRGGTPEVEVVPGVMAFQALAASAPRPVVEADQPMRIVTGLHGAGAVAEALEDPSCAVVVYKGGRHMGEIAEAIARSGRIGEAMLGELVGTAEQRVMPLSQWAGPASSYLATVIVAPRQAAGASQRGSGQ